MRDKLNEPFQLQGISVFLDEIQPKYFPYVIKWRNDKTLNQFLNQPVDLTMESQSKWYEEKYLKDDTQGFMIMVDKKTHVPFATFGWTDLDLRKKQCIMGRLVLGNSEFKNSPAFLEGIICLSDFIYSMINTVYIQLDPKNKKACRLNKTFGFLPNDKEVQYPEAIYVNGDPNRKQMEWYRTREMYQIIRKKLFEDIHDELFSEYK